MLKVLREFRGRGQTRRVSDEASKLHPNKGKDKKVSVLVTADYQACNFVHTHPSIHLSFYPSIFTSIDPSIHICMYVSTYVRMYVCMCACLSVCVLA